MSLSPIGSAVFELLSHKHTDIHTDIQTDSLLLYSNMSYEPNWPSANVIGSGRW